MGRAIREARAGWRLLEANFGRLRTPLKVVLCVTYRCQYRCKTCNIWKRRPSDELSTEELLRFIAGNREIAWLDVSGGEPFLRPDLSEIFDAIARDWKRLALIHFPTNGYLTDRIVSLTRRLAARTAARVVVTVSVDGDESLNDEIRGRPGGFRRQVETFNALRQIPGVRAVLGMTLSAYNVQQVEATFRACQQTCPGLRVEDFHINAAQLSDHYYGNLDCDDLLAPTDQLREAVRRHCEARGQPTSASGWLEARYLRLLDGYLESESAPMRCHALRSSCFVDPQGTVFPCITQGTPLGSLRETGMVLAPIWSSDESRRVQRDIWAGRCPQCWTACEAYQSILGNVLRPLSRPQVIRQTPWRSGAFDATARGHWRAETRGAPGYSDTTIVIPAKDEAPTIQAIVAACLPFAREVIVVDGHSRDGTAALAAAAGAHVLRDGGRGKGDAIRTVVPHVRTPISVFLDADGSHDPSDIPLLIEPIRSGDADHVSGSRLIGGSSELHGGFDEFFRLAGSAFITACINRRFGVRLSDSQNGFRALRTDVLRQLVLRANDTTIEQEMVSQTLAAGFRLSEVGTHEAARRFGHSHICVWRAAPSYVFSLARCLALHRVAATGRRASTDGVRPLAELPPTRGRSS